MDTKSTPIYGAALTHSGGRRTNEDAVYTCAAAEAAAVAARGHLYVVADGTGGQEGGQTASSIAKTVIAERFYDERFGDVGVSLRGAVTTAHEVLYEMAQRVPGWADISTTVVAAVLHQDTMYVAYVGDSRAYLVRDGEVRLLTRDHVWLEDDENYGALTRWLGGGHRASAEVDLLVESLQEGDIVVLCSDGLTDVVDGHDIRSAVANAAPHTGAKKLIDLANHRGTGDNVSVAVVRYGGRVPTTGGRRWAWIGAGVTLLLAVVVAAFVFPSSDDSDSILPLTATEWQRPPDIVTSTVPTEGERPDQLEGADGTLAPAETPIAPSPQVTREATSTPQPATETPTLAPTVAIADPPAYPTQPPADPPQPPADPTQPPADPPQPPADPTQPPADPTQPPADPTEPPADPTEPARE